MVLLCVGALCCSRSATARTYRLCVRLGCNDGADINLWDRDVAECATAAQLALGDHAYLAIGFQHNRGDELQAADACATDRLTNALLGRQVRPQRHRILLCFRNSGRPDEVARTSARIFGDGGRR